MVRMKRKWFKSITMNEWKLFTIFIIYSNSFLHNNITKRVSKMKMKKL